MTERKEKHKQKQKEGGITLIALVITIIVLLILAGVALAALTGDSGILNNAESAKTQTNHTSVAECMKLKMNEYLIEKRTNGYDKDFITFLKENPDGAIVDDNGVINVKNLLGKKSSAGNGNNLTDVYVIEDNKEVGEGKYALKYYTSRTQSQELGTMGELVIPTDSKYFDFEYDDTTTPPTAKLKGVKSGYIPTITYEDPMYHELNVTFPAYIKDGTNKITNIIIPTTVKKGDVTYTVTSIGNNAFGVVEYWNDYIGTDTWDDYRIYLFDLPSELENIIIPSTVTRIEDYSFMSCTKLKSITIPEGITYISGRAFYNMNLELETVYYEGTEAQWSMVQGNNVFGNDVRVICSDTVVE